MLEVILNGGSAGVDGQTTEQIVSGRRDTRDPSAISTDPGRE